LAHNRFYLKLFLYHLLLFFKLLFYL